MALAKVAKINIIAHQKHLADFLETLQNTGFIQIKDFEEDEILENQKENLSEKFAAIDYQLAGVKFSLDFLSKHEMEKQSLSEKLKPQIELSPVELENIVRNFNYREITERVQKIEGAINANLSAEEKLNLELEQITPWQKLGFIPGHEKKESDFDYKFISLTGEQNYKLSGRLKKDLPLSALEPVSEVSLDKKNQILSVLIFPKKEEAKVNEILAEEEIKLVELPSLNVAIPERLKQINGLLDQTDNELEKLKSQARKESNNIRGLKIIFDWLSWQKEKLSARQKFSKTDRTFSLIGWIDQDLISLLEKELDKISSDFMLNRLEIKKDETAPVIFKNKLAKDFESITSLYGTPQSHEPDPTPFLAPFFILFFGMAMTDAGYGLVMTLGIIAAIKILKIPRPKQKLLRVLALGGVATFILGALTGGWFSIELNILPSIIAEPLKQIRLIDPIENPLLIFYIALGLGVFQVLTGLAINIYWKIRSGRLAAGLFGSGSWFLTIVSLLVFAGGATGILPIIFKEIGQWLIFLGVLGIIYNGTRGTKNIFLKPGLGILSLYGAVGYFSDILSYSRLLALGLTTTIIGTVVNIIAGLVFTIPYVGWLAALIILIGGHVFNIAINALGAFIHSARLQFIEFFPKFLEAGGEAFEPFRKEAKYIRIKN